MYTTMAGVHYFDPAQRSQSPRSISNMMSGQNSSITRSGLKALAAEVSRLHPEAMDLLA